MEELWLNDKVTGNARRTPGQATRHGPTENICVNLSDNNMDYISESSKFDAPDDLDGIFPAHLNHMSNQLIVQAILNHALSGNG